MKNVWMTLNGRFLFIQRRNQIEKVIKPLFQKKCYIDWSKVRKCAEKNLGETFATRLNIIRNVEPEYLSDDERSHLFEEFLKGKDALLKEKEFRPKGEEEDEEEGGDGEEEGGDEEKEGKAEEASEVNENQEEANVEEVGEDMEVAI
jgi:hypothetical protein